MSFNGIFSTTCFSNSGYRNKTVFSFSSNMSFSSNPDKALNLILSPGFSLAEL